MEKKKKDLCDNIKITLNVNGLNTLIKRQNGRMYKKI